LNRERGASFRERNNGERDSEFSRQGASLGEEGVPLLLCDTRADVQIRYESVRGTLLFRERDGD
jgi:hypothetical protein